MAQGPGPEQEQQQRNVDIAQTSAPVGVGRVSSSAGTILHVQRLAGNRTASAFVQARLVVGHAADPSEFEADAVADAVVRRLRDASIGDDAEGGDAEAGVVRRRSGGTDLLGGLSVDADTTRDIESARSGGRSLPVGLRRSMEEGFGSDFTSVRIHDDRGADSLNRRLQAKAFTTGVDIFFRAGGFEPQTDQGQHLLAHELAHVVQQSAAPAAVSRVVQREEEDDKRDRLEKEKTKKEKKRDKSDTAAIRKERQLAQKYGKRIGPADSEIEMGETDDKGKVKVNPHFSMKMLNKIEQMLDLLPEAHVKGNASLLGLLNDNATMDGPASTYDFESKYIGLHKPVAMMPEWLYFALSPRYAVLREKMDQDTIAGYDPGGDYKGNAKGVGKFRNERDKRLGVDTKDRRIFGGVSNALCGSSLVEYTIVHEIGHSVDKQIGFQEHLSKEAMFGGWKTFKERGPILHVFIEDEGLKMDDLNRRPGRFRNKGSLGLYLDYHWAVEDLNELQSATDELAGTDEELAKKLASVVGRLQFAQAQPWTFDDGGGDKVDVDGRMYGLDYHGTWQSYLRKERDFAVSNYQFSEPGEWFGEAYAAFYGGSEAARHRLSKAVQVWFDKTLGPPPSMKQDDKPASLVATDDGGPKLGTFDAESALASVKAALADLEEEFDANYL